MSDLVPYLAGLAIVVVLVAKDAIDRPSPSDVDSLTSNDERCKALRLRQERARQRMERLGIKTLLKGRPGWRTVNPMSEPRPPRANKVVRIR